MRIPTVQRPSLEALLTLGLIAAVGCSTEVELGEEDDRTVASPCVQYASVIAHCGGHGVIWGIVGGIGGGTVGTALPVIGTVSGACIGAGSNACAGVLSCLHDHGLFEFGELWDLGRACGESVPLGPVAGDLTPDMCGSLWEDDDPVVDCTQIVRSREHTCTDPQECDQDLNDTVLCDEVWTDECEQGLQTCVGNTQEKRAENAAEEAAANVAAATMRVDFNRDGIADGGDVRSLMIAIDVDSAMADLNRDGNLDTLDRDYLVHDLMGVAYGDANLDGVVDSSDLVAAFAAGKYETGEEASWEQGDWDGDGVFTTADMVTAFADGCYEQGPGCIVSQYAG